MSYYEKYLKYKSKYLELKSQIGSAVPIIYIPRPHPVNFNEPSVLSNHFAVQVFNQTITYQVVNNIIQFNVPRGIRPNISADRMTVTIVNDVFWLMTPLVGNNELANLTQAKHCIQAHPPLDNYNGTTLRDLITVLQLPATVRDDVFEFKRLIN